MKKLSVALAVLASLAGTACDVEEPLDAQGLEDVELRDGPSQAFLDAQQAIDESVVTIQQAGNFEWPVLEHRLVELAGYIQPSAMTPAERDLIDAHALDASEEIEPQLAYLAANTQFPGIEHFTGTCYTRCMGFIEVACETGTTVGMCVGLWGCNAEMGAHNCLGSEVTDQSDCNGEVCGPGWRCAHWAFKADECVKECDDNSDCPGSQKCKQPFGTTFKRCK